MKFPCLVVLVAAQLVVVLCSLELKDAARLICYSCRDSKVQKNNTCLNMPTDTEDYKTVCAKKFCFVKRVQVTRTGEIHLVERGCVGDVAIGVETTAGYTTYLRTCNISLCNDWDGIADKYPVSSAEDDSVVTTGVNGDDSVVILAPGSPSLAPTIHSIVLPLLPLLLLTRLCDLVLYAAAL